MWTPAEMERPRGAVTYFTEPEDAQPQGAGCGGGCGPGRVVKWKHTS